MKIGIYTFHYENNYGAMLQAYATQKILQAMGHDVEFIFQRRDYHIKANNYAVLTLNPKSWIKFVYAQSHPAIRKRLKNFRTFHSRLRLSRLYRHVSELHEQPPDYDVHLVGSDQVWYLREKIQKERYFFLDFLPANSCKISFSSSLGSSSVWPGNIPIVKSALSDFVALSTREIEGAKILSELIDREVQDVLDPCFLLDVKNWEKISRLPPCPQEYILCYGFDDSESSRAMLLSIKRRMKLPLVFVSSSGLLKPNGVDYFIKSAGPADFVGLVNEAKFVFSGSYHGVVFSVLFRKSFFVVSHPTKNMRISSLLAKLGLMSRQISEPTAIDDFLEKDIFIDYAYYDRIIMESISSSIEWLETALDKIKVISQ